MQPQLPAQFTGPSAADPELLGVVSTLTRELVDLDSRIEEAEKVLDTLKSRRKQVAEVEIPERMTTLGVSDLTTTEGFKLSIKPFYHTGICRLYENGPYNPAAFKWLEDNGHGGVIKTAIEIPFQKGELEIAREFFNKYIQPRYPSAALEQSVHHATLAALTRQIMECGQSLPENLFNVHSGQVAKVKVPKNI